MYIYRALVPKPGTLQNARSELAAGLCETANNQRPTPAASRGGSGAEADILSLAQAKPLQVVLSWQ